MKHPQLHWWINHKFEGLQPFLSGHPRAKAFKVSNFIVAFDVHFRYCSKGTKGFVGLESPTWFYQNLMMKVALKERIFYQVIIPDISACFYFDIDASELGFPMNDFIQAVFEEMAKEQSILNVEELWRTTVLLDALCNVKGVPKKSSTHGICHGLIFSDNHTSMKAFAIRIKTRLENRPDAARFRVMKKGELVIPFDLAVYSRHQNFRFYGNSKLEPLDDERRPLIISPYNRFEGMPNTDLDIFLLTMIDQGKLVNIEIVIEPEFKKPRTSSIPEKEVPIHADLKSFLLDQLHMWGNDRAYVSSATLARNGTDGEIYVSFANATYAETHKHRSNNLFAIVNVKTLLIKWHCHGHKCKNEGQVLPMSVALKILK
jgi:hypothetical protein